DGYNTEIMRRNLVQEYGESGEPWKPLPYIVIIIDELADLMLSSGREVEESITRLAQMARAVGIHLVLATQRPSVDVITGLIKAQGSPVYDDTITRSEEEALGLEDMDGERDELFEEALRICVEMKRASTSVLQRRLRVGYGRAAAILDIMERDGLIGQADGSR